MSIRRDADGNIFEEKTERAGAFGREAGPEAPTIGKGPQPVPPAQPDVEADPRVMPQQAGQPSGYEADTVLARSEPGDSQAQDGPADQAAAADLSPEPRTRIYRPGAKKSQPSERPPEQAAEAEQAVDPPSADAMDDPPVGWLVVIQGPGQGNVVTIGNGSNSLGRDPGERICVDFGDETISRSGHSVITYDPKGRKFYLQHGGGKNLTYIEDSPVLAPTELRAFSKIQLGESVLLFVPLCGEQFEWADYE